MTLDDELQAALNRWVQESPLNRLPDDSGPIFDPPLWGCADGDDPLWAQYQTIIGPEHLTPREVLGVSPWRPLRVWCWVLPIAEAIRASNRREDAVPSLWWGQQRQHGEELNDALRRHAEDWLRARGYLAVAPVISDRFVIDWSTAGAGPKSNWSERHAIYVAGMGSFSLSDGFITARGIAMRCGSLVTDAPLSVTPRRIDDPYALCPELAGGTCGVCIQRCPAGAITAAGHDKVRCLEYQREAIAPLRDRLYRVKTIGCGLCQVRVPCEFGIPPRPDADHRAREESA